MGGLKEDGRRGKGRTETEETQVCECVGEQQHDTR